MTHSQQPDTDFARAASDASTRSLSSPAISVQPDHHGNQQNLSSNPPKLHWPGGPSAEGAYATNPYADEENDHFIYNTTEPGDVLQNEFDRSYHGLSTVHDTQDLSEQKDLAVSNTNTWDAGHSSYLDVDSLTYEPEEDLIRGQVPASFQSGSRDSSRQYTIKQQPQTTTTQTVTSPQVAQSASATFLQGTFAVPPPKSALKRKPESNSSTSTDQGQISKRSSLDENATPRQRSVKFDPMPKSAKSPSLEVTNPGGSKNESNTGSTRAGSSSSRPQAVAAADRGSPHRPQVRIPSSATSPFATRTNPPPRNRAIPAGLPLPSILPPEKVFPIQIGSDLFRLSGASIASDGENGHDSFVAAAC